MIAASIAQVPGNGNGTVLVIHRSVRSLIPQFLFGFLASFLAWYLVDRNFGGSLKLQSGSLGTFTIQLWPFVLAALLVRPFFFIFNCRHRVSPHHVRSEWGRLSFRREEVEISFANLRGIKIKQSFIERMLDVGAIVGWTGPSEHPDLVMEGVSDPHAVLKIMGARLDRARSGQAWNE